MKIVTLIVICFLSEFIHPSRALAESCESPPLGSSDSWLPETKMPSKSYEKPLAHFEGGGDCDFYKAAWQTFLYVTSSSAGAYPKFVSYPNISNTFGKKFLSSVKIPKSKLFLLPRSQKGPNESVLPVDEQFEPDAGIEQAGLHQILIDQNGNPIFYSVHFDTQMQTFLKGISDEALIRAFDPSLVYPTGSVELKAAWMIVENDDRDLDVSEKNYFVVNAEIPRLVIKDNKVKLDTNSPSRNVRVALLSLHVVFIMEGHPEFIWATFEHVDKEGHRDNAPAVLKNPKDYDSDFIVDSNKNYPLYAKGTKASEANLQLQPVDVAKAFDKKTQKFSPSVRTSVYRVFPASKVNDVVEDGDITNLNNDIRLKFMKIQSGDRRSNYQLVGAVWLDNPVRDFALMKPLDNPTGVSSDETNGSGVIAGEDRLSSTAMESFTQISKYSCFSCHDARRINDLKHPLDAKKINVSHIPSMFLRNISE